MTMSRSTKAQPSAPTRDRASRDGERTANAPVAVFRYRGVSASVFENRSEQDIPYFKVSVVRTYKDGEEFKTTSAFSRDDLPIVVHVAEQAWDWILNAEASQRANDAAD